ncbi:YaiO family outer membrane beta-barrel protein [Flavobacterium sufflavum]|uniref:YaiO family outer membrane beta-barrel protein n=1 Tax=Flavobacterium sufflavum TaxID=1921138 RepID=A0A437KXN0_9FLAO|nr:YaiO family outer membrane beta-barrel protein [Flavobacterium sufflavum]RVT77343.1 YaiO family outer membrane beta-barrel protein [Flavobacterium sufflavum]
MIRKPIIKLTILFTLACFFQMQGQVIPYNGNPDTSFETARQLAFNKQRKQAQDTLVKILNKYPDYHEIRSFLGSTYAWDGDYKKARKEFAYVIEKAPQNKENWIAAIKNESWSDAHYDALEMSKKALKIFPNDSEITILKATALKNTNNSLEAQSTIKEFIAKNPEDQKSKEFLNDLNSTLRTNDIGVRASVDIYSKTFDPMQYYSLSYSKQTKYGSIIGRVNFNRRFNENGAQLEVDMYPKITKGLYAYVNAGYANSFIFPDLRYGAELYKSLPHSLEISAGFRTLKYSTTTNIYTGSIGWYTGNSYWSLRPYFTPGDGGTSTSAALNYRKYRSNADNYISFVYSMGISPEVNQFIFDSNDAAIINLKTQRLNVGYFFTTSKNKDAWGAQFDVAHQEISFDPGNYFWIYSLSVSWNLKFK